MNDAEKLVEFSLNLSLRDIPPQVIKPAKHRIMDILGDTLADVKEDGYERMT